MSDLVGKDATRYTRYNPRIGHGRPPSHFADLKVLVRVGGNVFAVQCRHCDFTTGYGSKQAAQDALDSHQIFTHVTGSYLCGYSGGNTYRAGLPPRCQGCLTIRRLRRQLGLQARYVGPVVRRTPALGAPSGCLD